MISTKSEHAEREMTTKIVNLRRVRGQHTRLNIVLDFPSDDAALTARVWSSVATFMQTVLTPEEQSVFDSLLQREFDRLPASDGMRHVRIARAKED